MYKGDNLPNYLDYISVDIFGPQYEIPLSSISSLELTHSEDFKNRLALLFEMMQDMNGEKTVSELFEVAIKYAGRVLQVDRASISYIDEAKDTLTLTALYGIEAGNPKDIILPLKVSATGHLYLLDSISYRPQLDNCTCPVVTRLYENGLNSVLVAPIVSGNIRFGTINTANTKLDGYNNDDIHLIAQISAILSTHLHNALLREKAQKQEQNLIQQNNKLEKLAYVDSLTKIYNRRYINTIIEHEILQSQRNSSKFSIILIDIDFFKKINDDFGHLVGDSTLIELSSLIQNNIRANDVFARWGGEEFLIVCLDTNVQDTHKLAQKIRILVAESKNSTLESLTISLGVTSFVETDSLDSLLKRADIALYSSKEKGRNQTTIN